jgi:translation initiation factor IF-2
MKKKGQSVFPISAATGEGIPELLDAVIKQLLSGELPGRGVGSKQGTDPSTAAPES